MSWFLDSPVPILVIGATVEAVLAIVLLTTRRGAVLYAMAGVLAAILLGVWLQRVIVTDRKLIQGTLETARAAVERNDRAAVLDQVAPSATEVRELVATAMGMLRFTEASIHDLKITVNQKSTPPTARAEFTALATFEPLRGDLPYSRDIAEMVVGLERTNRRWWIIKVEDIRRPNLLGGAAAAK